MIEQLFLDGVAVEAGDGAQATRDRRLRAPGGFHLATERLDVDPPRSEHM
jgi:hypothetical protein